MIVYFKDIAEQIRVLPPSTAYDETSEVWQIPAPNPKFLNDLITVYNGKSWPTAKASSKIEFGISMNDENNPNKYLGKWFQPAWSFINIARGDMFEWWEIKTEILDLAKILKKTFGDCSITHPSIGGKKSNFNVRRIY